MTPQTATLPDSLPDGIKHVPQEVATRDAIRALAGELAAGICRGSTCSREELERHGETLLQRLGLPRQFLGFAMVAVSNELWRTTFAATAFDRRLFLLPHCLADRDACRGTYDSIGLNCAGCGSCSIDGLRREAERLGYTVVIAEGTGSVIEKILDDEADAILGVACLDSLEKSFHRVVELGVPHVALPLLSNGCVNTQAEIDEIRLMLTATAAEAEPVSRSYVPLLRETARMLRQPLLADLLALGNEPPTPVEDIAVAWLADGGKRLRPFVTIAAFAVGRHGVEILTCGEKTSDMIPQPIRRVALAIEALHKASLVHDDIEDDDDLRYGRPTLHRVHGISQAVNIGDYLIGLGYRLVAAEKAALGAECVADIVACLSQAHLELCRGQGQELAQRGSRHAMSPMQVLAAYALKTSPAFEAALYAGLRLADVDVDATSLRRFSTFLGEAFQIQNDLDDWQQRGNEKGKHGSDAQAGRMTILAAFAVEAGCDQALAEIAGRRRELSQNALVDRLREIYQRSGAFDRAERLLQKLRARALDAADGFPTGDLQELMRFLVRVVLRETT